MKRQARESRPSQRPKTSARARALTATLVAILVPVALTAAGCTSTASARNRSVPLAISPAVLSPNPARGDPMIPVSRYLNVVQNYDVHSRGDTPGQARYTVTNPATITKLAGLIDALPVSPTQDIHPCPSALAPAFELDFQDTKDGGADMQVSIECFGVMISAGGRDEPLRSDSATSADVQSLLKETETLLAPYRATGIVG